MDTHRIAAHWPPPLRPTLTTSGDRAITSDWLYSLGATSVHCNGARVPRRAGHPRAGCRQCSGVGYRALDRAPWVAMCPCTLLDTSWQDDARAMQRRTTLGFVLAVPAAVLAVLLLSWLARGM